MMIINKSITLFFLGYVCKWRYSSLCQPDARISGKRDDIRGPDETCAGGANGLMDFLFLSLFQWAKEEGYHYFNLGMAPLSKVGKSYYARDMESMAALLYDHGSSLYSFEGLYQFKNKYKPVWSPKYLVYKKESKLSEVLYSVMRLIS